MKDRHGNHRDTIVIVLAIGLLLLGLAAMAIPIMLDNQELFSEETQYKELAEELKGTDGMLMESESPVTAAEPPEADPSAGTELLSTIPQSVDPSETPADAFSVYVVPTALVHNERPSSPSVPTKSKDSEDCRW